MDLNSLDYFILGELVICVLSLVMCCNIFISFSFFDRRHRLFMCGGISSFFASFFDILAVICISNNEEVPVVLSTLVSTIYFMFLLMVPFTLASYANDVAFSYKKGGKVGFWLNGIIYSIYLSIVLLNIKTGWIFRYDKVDGYIRGPLKFMTYILTFYFAIYTIVVIVLNRRSIARRIYAVFLAYPVISLFFIMVQFFNPKALLTGASGFTALFFAYITIQSDLIEFDTITGLMTESKLKKQLSLKNSEGYLYILSIDNMNYLQSNMDASELNTMLLNIGRQFTKLFERYSYHVTTNRFAGICKTREQLEDFSQKIQLFIENINEKKDSNVPVSLEVYSSAIAFSKGEVSYENLMEVINSMLMKSKNDSIHTMQLCDEAILVEMERKRYIFKILKRELNLDSTQFQVWYQPIYSTKDKKFVYMEALSRLNGTEIGNISPQEFVGVAESRGLIERLGFVAFEKVCKFISENRSLVQAVSINFSVYQMTNPKLVRNVLSTINRFGLDPSNIIMEITESIFIDDMELVLSNMNKLVAAGVKFYLDDFGTGYSNLANVIGLPFSTIKIDRSLVLMMEESKKGEHFFSNLISTFRDAGLNILVEGVETNNQNYLVEKAGTDYIQGFLYSRPLSESDCLELLRRQERM